MKFNNKLLCAHCFEDQDLESSTMTDMMIKSLVDGQYIRITCYKCHKNTEVNFNVKGVDVLYSKEKMQGDKSNE